jgi:type II secretory pathway pseudopilin PulG
MSFQKSEIFPALSSATKQQQAQATQAQATQAQAQQQQAQATQAQATPAKQVAGTPFVWSKLVNGEKKDLAQVQLEEKNKKDAAELALKEKENKRMELHLRDKLAKEKRSAEFTTENAIRKALAAEEQKKMDEKYSRENGWWNTCLAYPEDDHSQYDIPKSVKEKSLEFVQLWLTTYPELAKIRTMGELQKAFYAAYFPWLLMKYQRSAYVFEEWEKREYPIIHCLGVDIYAQRYAHLQKWVIHEEQAYNTSALKNNCLGPWALYPIWIAAQQITWENCVFAMSKISGTFANGLLEITGHYSKPTAQIKWVVNLEPYIATRFKSKPESLTKQKREREREDDEYY